MQKNMNKIKQRILLYAEMDRKISELSETYASIIAEELLKIYPEINDINSDDPALNWAYDIINSNSNAEVIETLNRLESIIDSKRINDALGSKSFLNNELSREEVLELKVKELQNYVEELEGELKGQKIAKLR